MLSLLSCGDDSPVEDLGGERSATRRLTVEEWQNTVVDLLGVEVDATLLPADEFTAGFPANVSSGLSELEVEDLLAAAEAAALAATAEVDTLLGCSASDRTCVEGWAGPYLERAWRRPVEASEVADLLALYDLGETPADGVRLAITGSLVAGSFLYRPVIAETEPIAGRVALDDWEMASRLSYLLWRTMPDEELFAAARAGALSTREEVEAQAMRMLADPRGARTLGSFTLDWFGLANLSQLDRVQSTQLEIPLPPVTLLDQPLEQWVATDAFASDLPEGIFVESSVGDGPLAVVTGPSDGEVFLHHGIATGNLFSFTGKISVDDPAASIGMTFLSNVPGSNSFYRVQRLPGQPIALTSSGANDACNRSSPYELVPGEVTEFSIEVFINPDEVYLSIFLFPEGEAKPEQAAMFCKDQKFTRLTTGTVGLWATGPGTKWWSELVVETTQPPAPFDYQVVSQLYTDATRSFVEAWAMEGAVLQDLLLADWTMANEAFAPYIGLEGIVGSDFQRVTLPPERVGLLTQPAFLTQQAKPNQSSPVLRGKSVREALLCDTVPPPPAGLIVIPPDPDPNLTTRERFAVHVEEESCAACHLQMDPIGFGFENFDQVGMYRADEYGLPIDASGEIVLAYDADGTFADVQGLAELLAQSDEVRSCVVRHWYRYVAAHYEDANAPDPAFTQALAACTDETCAVEAIVLPMVGADSFRYRAAHDGDPE
jgi:hypothetical protein